MAIATPSSESSRLSAEFGVEVSAREIRARLRHCLLTSQFDPIQSLICLARDAKDEKLRASLTEKLLIYAYPALEQGGESEMPLIDLTGIGPADPPV